MKKKVVVVKQKGRTISRDELARLAFCNAKRMPQVVNDNGVRKRWMGIGWVNVGVPTGREIKVVDK